jgi:hypothetical protein
VSLEATGMTPELFATARRRLPLNRWDELQLAALGRYDTACAPLAAAIAGRGGGNSDCSTHRGHSSVDLRWAVAGGLSGSVEGGRVCPPFSRHSEVDRV